MIHTARILFTLVAITAASAVSENPTGGRADSSESRDISSVRATSHSAPHQGGSLPTLTVRDASLDQTEMLRWSLDRFTEAGLGLPPLDVTFHPDVRACNGFGGIYRTRGDVAVIDICHTRRHIILHELGHAWDGQQLADQTRERFLTYHGLASWSDPSVAWEERGIEQAADTIALVLNWHSYAGSIDQPGVVHRLCGYEVLTGNPLPDSVPVSCALHNSRTLHPAGTEGAPGGMWTRIAVRTRSGVVTFAKGDQ
jgi:hypothetical protein